MINISSHYKTDLEQTFKFDTLTHIYQYIDSYIAEIIQSSANECIFSYLLDNKTLQYQEKIQIVSCLKSYQYLINECDIFQLINYSIYHENDTHNLSVIYFIANQYKESFNDFRTEQKKNCALHMLLKREDYNYYSLHNILNFWVETYSNSENKPEILSNNQGIHPIHVLCRSRMSTHVRTQCLEKILSMPHVHIDLTTKQGNTLLHLVLRKVANPDFLAVLIEKGASFSIPNKFGTTGFDLYSDYFDKIFIRYLDKPNQLEHYQRMKDGIEKKHLEFIIKKQQTKPNRQKI
jgi:hypothetical protein